MAGEGEALIMGNKFGSNYIAISDALIKETRKYSMVE
jgi:hypothetical protein